MPKWKLLLTISSLSLLSSCATPALFATPTPSAATNAPDQVAKVCIVLKPIIYSRLHDTAETITQVQQQNAAIVGLCPQYAPKP